MRVNIEQAAAALRGARDVVIIAHKSPDGDTLGSSFALYYALCGLGARARVECSDPIPPKYEYFTGGYAPADFAPGFVVAVDVADLKLFGPGTRPYGERVDLCIDHHQTNTAYARMLLVDASCAATAQLMYQVLCQMGAGITPKIADCLFTGLSTDTGCFRYSNVTSGTHALAARLMELGADAGSINRLMFETKSKSRIAVERHVLGTLEYDFGGRCAMVHVSRDILERTGATEDELEGVSAIPRQIEGVWVGVTLNEREGGYKISLRTGERLDASEICQRLGGGGHKRAAGCFIHGDLAGAKARVRAVLAEFLG